MTKFSVEQLVIIINSPYSDVPKGTRGRIRKIYPNCFGRNDPLFELKEMSVGDHRLFRYHEIIPYPMEES